MAEYSYKRPMQATFVKSVTRPGKYYDGPGNSGLHLRVRKSKNGKRTLKTWLHTITIDGKSVDLGLGSYRLVTLARARDKAVENARIVEDGGDPRDKKDPAPTLAEAAEIVIELRFVGKDKGFAEEKRGLLRNHCAPLLTKRVDAIKRVDVQQTLAPIWGSKPIAASNALALLSWIFDWVIAKEYRPDNPADRPTTRMLPDIRHETKNFPSVPFQDVEEFIEQLHTYEVRDKAVPLASEFKTLTGTRSAEANGARWDEIHLNHVVFKPKTKGMAPLR